MPKNTRFSARPNLSIDENGQTDLCNYTYNDQYNVSPPTSQWGDARQLSFFDTSPPEVVLELFPPCKCGSIIGKERLEPETSPHHSRLTCLSCGRWVKFVARKESLLGGLN